LEKRCRIYFLEKVSGLFSFTRWDQAKKINPAPFFQNCFVASLLAKTH